MQKAESPAELETIPGLAETERRESLSEIETPAVLIDLDVVDANIHRMQAAMDGRGVGGIGTSMVSAYAEVGATIVSADRGGKGSHAAAATSTSPMRPQQAPPSRTSSRHTDDSTHLFTRPACLARPQTR